MQSNISFIRLYILQQNEIELNLFKLKYELNKKNNNFIKLFKFYNLLFIQFNLINNLINNFIQNNIYNKFKSNFLIKDKYINIKI